MFRLKGDTDSALTDLHTAIELSGGRGGAAAQAYTQHGLILMLQGEEDQALEDFKVNLDICTHSLIACLAPH